MSKEAYMELALNHARMSVLHGDGGPFGACVVKDDKVIGIGKNEVLKHNDPTCHGEIQAIGMACHSLGTYDLSGCELYTTAYPCPMCLGAIQWARIDKVYYGCTIEDAESIGFDDKKFYENNQLDLEELGRDSCLELFKLYEQTDHTIY